MRLPHDASFRFIEGYKAILLHVFDNSGLTRTRSISEDLATARSLAKSKPILIDLAIGELESLGQAVDARVVRAVKSMKVDRWIYLRHTQNFAVLIDIQSENAYELKVLTTPLYELLGNPPLVLETGIFEYEGFYVCDGLAVNPIGLGPGYKAQYANTYKSLRKAGRLHKRTDSV